MNKKVVVFGGGTGISYLLEGLKLFPLDITAVISVSDNGSSTGKLREEFHMPAIGDIRKVIISLSNVNEDIKKMLSYRFDTYSDLNGHPLGNLIMVGMYNITGSLKESISTLSNFLNVKSKVLPISEDNLTLVGKTVTGKEITGESEITSSNEMFDDFYYKEEPKVLPEVLKAVKEADLLIFSMGSLYTSILPHILCQELIKKIKSSPGKIMYTCNAVTQPGETDNFKVSDHIKILNKYLDKRKIDVVIAASSKIPQKIVQTYTTTEQKDLVLIDEQNIKNLDCELIAGDILTVEDNMIRHNSLKLANVIFNYLMR